MRNAWKIVIVIVIIGLVAALIELLKQNKTLVDANVEAEKRNKDVELAYNALDKLMERYQIEFDSAEVVGAYLREDYTNINIRRDEIINQAIPNYVDVMSYSDQQQRSELSRLNKNIDVLWRQLREVQERDSIQ